VEVFEEALIGSDLNAEVLKASVDGGLDVGFVVGFLVGLKLA